MKSNVFLTIPVVSNIQFNVCEETDRQITQRHTTQNQPQPRYIYDLFSHIFISICCVQNLKNQK